MRSLRRISCQFSIFTIERTEPYFKPGIQIWIISALQDIIFGDYKQIVKTTVFRMLKFWNIIFQKRSHRNLKSCQGKDNGLNLQHTEGF